MRQEFLNEVKGQSLKLFISGYGQDPTPFRALCGETTVAMLYDYESLDCDLDIYENFTNIEIIAWSIGVMLTPYLVDKSKLRSKITKAIAVNGTPDGIVFKDGEIGLEQKLWYLSYENMDSRAQAQFISAMLGRDPTFYMENLPQRSALSCKAELLALYEFKRQQQERPCFNYDVAYIGTRDKIFPPAILRQAFSDTATAIIKGPWAHFDKELFSKLLGSC